jgi:tetratricopeptide (TPR) repeat protein
MSIVILIIVLGIGIAIVTVIVVRSIVAPRRISTLADQVKQKRTASAIKTAKKILQKDPRNTDAHYLLGLAYLDDNKPELALMEFKTVNQIGTFDGYTKEVPFRLKIAELYASFNQPEEALKEYLILLKRDPNNADLYYRVGRLFEDRNRTDKAGGYFKKAVELEPNHADAHFRLGLLFYRAKKYPEAKAEFESAIRCASQHNEAYYYLGKIQKENKDFISALSSLEKAARSPELKVKALVERGTAYMSTNNIDRAMAELERAVKLAQEDSAPEVLYGRYFLAKCYEKMRNLDQAIEQWEAIYRHKQNFRDVGQKLAEYQDLRTDDRVKDYLTATQEQFVELCEQVTAAIGLQVRDIEPIGEGCQVIAFEPQSKWRNARRMPKMVRYLRVTKAVDEATIREMHEEMKKQNITRGVLASSSGFSRLAEQFAETRPIDLVGREKLQQLLQRID